MSKIIILLILKLISISCILYLYLKSKKVLKLKRQIKDLIKRVPAASTLIIGNDSLGTSNRAKGFGNLISEKFEVYFNFSCAVIFNKTFSFKSMLKNNLSLSEIKKIQSLSTEKIKNDLGILNFMLNSVEMQEEYELESGDENLKISSLIKNSNSTYFIVTTGSNDLMHELNADPISIVLDKEKRLEALDKIKKNSITKIVSNVIKNVTSVISDIKSINPNTKIIVLGLYVPNYIKFFEKFYDNNYITQLIDEYNIKLYHMCIDNNIKFVMLNDINSHVAFLDFHPNKFGQLLIAKKVLIAILNYGCKINKINENEFQINNNGLNGFIVDAKNRLHLTEDRTDLSIRDKKDKIAEYTDEIKILREVINSK